METEAKFSRIDGTINPKTGKKTNLTEFAFMNAGNKDKFAAGLKEEIEKSW